MLLSKLILYHLPLLTGVLFTVVSTNTYDEENRKVRSSSSSTTTRTLLTVITTRGDKTQEKRYDAEYIENRRQLPGSYQLFYEKNTDWCAPLPDTVHLPKYGNGWVALIPDDETRKNCTCADKLRTAKSYNASAAIVLFSYCGIRPSDSPKLPLTAITVNRHNGLEIIDIYKKQDSRQVLCKISKRKKHKDKQFRVSKTSVLFVLVSFILLMCISLAWLVFYYVQRFRHIYRNDRKERQLLNAAKKAISKLKTAPFNSALASGDDADCDCAICLGNYKDGETVRILPCKHLFHKSCIDPWLLNHRTCPLCKNNILKSLGVEIPDNINLTHYDVDSSARASSRDVEAADHSAPVPSSSSSSNNGGGGGGGGGDDDESGDLVTLNTPVEALLPSGGSGGGSVFATTTGAGSSSSQASWGESIHHHHHHHHHHAVSASVSSSTSSMLSDTDSERSTVALVSAAQKV